MKVAFISSSGGPCPPDTLLPGNPPRRRFVREPRPRTGFLQLTRRISASLDLFEHWLRRNFRRFLLGLHQLDVETERLQLPDQHVERLGQTRRERRIALDDRLVNLR